MKVNFFRVHFWNVGTSFSLNSILSKKFKSLIKANDNSWGAGMEKSRLKNSSFVWNIFIKRLNSLPLEEKTLTRPCPRKKSLADNQRLTKDFIKILWNEKNSPKLSARFLIAKCWKHLYFLLYSRRVRIKFLVS